MNHAVYKNVLRSTRTIRAKGRTTWLARQRNKKNKKKNTKNGRAAKAKPKNCSALAPAQRDRKNLFERKMFGLWEPAGLEIIRLWEDLAMFRTRKRLKRWFDFKRLRNRKRVVRYRSPVVKF